MAGPANIAYRDPDQRSEYTRFLEIPLTERLEILETMSIREKWRLAHDWSCRGRPAQQEPADFRSGAKRAWLITAGRGWGKTRTGASTVVKRVLRGGARRIALVGQTDKSCREIMVEGPAGLVAASPPWFKPHVQPGKHRVLWPNGAMATWYSSRVPDSLRGPEHDFAWMDEPAHYQWPDAIHDNLMFGLRHGAAQIVYTTTPLPIALMRKLHADPSCIVTQGSSRDNIENLSLFYEEIIDRYEGTRLGRQEVEGELLLDVPGALWNWAMIEGGLDPDGVTVRKSCRVRIQDLPDMIRVVVGVDPAVTSGENSDETGIVIAAKGSDGLGYVFEDGSARMLPYVWARRAISLFEEHRADYIVAEVNNGGDLVEMNIRAVDPTIPYRKVHASRGKVTRAQPIATLYEKGRIKHVIGADLKVLEDQMILFTPDNQFVKSPDRVDALVWALTELLLPAKGSPMARAA